MFIRFHKILNFSLDTLDSNSYEYIFFMVFFPQIIITEAK